MRRRLDSIHLHSSGAQEVSFNDFLRRLAPWLASGKFSATEMTYIDGELDGMYMYESDRVCVCTESWCVYSLAAIYQMSPHYPSSRYKLGSGAFRSSFSSGSLGKRELICRQVKKKC